MDIKSVSISNFRSINDELEVPLSGPMTFLVGPNNSGKTNILRCLAFIFNRAFAELDDSLDFESRQPKVLKFKLILDKSIFDPWTSGKVNLHRYLSKSIQNARFSVSVEVSKNGNSIVSLDENFFEIVPKEYFANDRFLNDFGQSGGQEHNQRIFVEQLNPLQKLSGTIHVPGIRFVTNSGQSIPHFGQTKFPGSTISPESIVTDLASIANPSGDAVSRLAARERHRGVCNFMQYCLEKQKVDVLIPHDKSTIFVEIDGMEQPLSNLGTGIEQLLIIGMAANMFPGRLVLLDEPELHFHPRTQKRMMKFLADSAQGKFVIATHSASVLDAVEADIVQLETNENKCRGRKIENNHDRFNAIKNLGHSASELVQANFIIWVEGPSDRIFINHLIRLIAPELTDGIDYSIIFYGGSILAQHSYSDDENDLVKALSVSRQFAVYIDSDKSSETAPLKARAKRIQSEVQKLDSYCWISKGREIENYVPSSIVEELAKSSKGVTVPNDMFGSILDPKIISKVEFANKAIANWTEQWPLDLKARIEELIEKIRAAA